MAKLWQTPFFLSFEIEYHTKSSLAAAAAVRMSGNVLAQAERVGFSLFSLLPQLGLRATKDTTLERADFTAQL